LGQAPEKAKLAVKTLLIDTGPLVAYLDRSDGEHHTIAPFLRDFRGDLCTTSAVMTEAMHLLKDHPVGPRRLAEFIQAAQIHVFESTQPQQLLSAVSLIEKYADTAMDFADATLVLLGDEIRVNQIVTLDRRGFRIFRTRKGKPFEIMPHA
jgi:predicted nucleic acid-binding protein